MTCASVDSGGENAGRGKKQQPPSDEATCSRLGDVYGTSLVPRIHISTFNHESALYIRSVLNLKLVSYSLPS